MYKSLKRWRRGARLFVLLRRGELPVACAPLSADVALNKVSEAVEALVEQVLLVPAPRLRLLKHKRTWGGLD